MSNQFSNVQLPPEAVDILRSVGIDNMEQLADANVSDLQGVFIKAASEGRFPEKYPSLVKIAAWVEQARIFAARQPKGGPSNDIDNIPTAVVKRPGQGQPKRAYPGSGRGPAKLVELRPDRHRVRKQADPNRQTPVGGQIGVTPRQDQTTDPVTTELNPEAKRTLRHHRSNPVPLQQSAAKQQAGTPAAEAVPAQAAPEEPAAPPPPARKSAFHSFDDYKEGRISVKPLDRHSLRLGEDTSKDTGSEQSSFEDEQVEKRRMPRTHARGVKHPDAFKVFFGAFVTLTAVVLTAVTAIGCVIFPFFLEKDYKLEFVLVFAAALVFGLMYLIVAVDTRCRVCSCHLFYSRRCLKNVKAHRILGGFPMVSQTIHILLFHWFRCMYCGTAIRLKDES